MLCVNLSKGRRDDIWQMHLSTVRCISRELLSISTALLSNWHISILCAALGCRLTLKHTCCTLLFSKSLWRRVGFNCISVCRWQQSLSAWCARVALASSAEQEKCDVKWNFVDGSNWQLIRKTDPTETVEIRN